MTTKETRSLEIISEELFLAYCNMGEIKEILRYFETQKTSNSELKKYSKRGLEYLLPTQKKFEQIVDELRAREEKSNYSELT